MTDPQKMLIHAGKELTKVKHNVSKCLGHEVKYLKGNKRW